MGLHVLRKYRLRSHNLQNYFLPLIIKTKINSVAVVDRTLQFKELVLLVGFGSLWFLRRGLTVVTAGLEFTVWLGWPEVAVILLPRPSLSAGNTSVSPIPALAFGSNPKFLLCHCCKLIALITGEHLCCGYTVCLH